MIEIIKKILVIFGLLLLVPLVSAEVRVNLTFDTKDGFYNTTHIENLGSGNDYRVRDADYNLSGRGYDGYYTLGSSKFINATSFRTISENRLQTTQCLWIRVTTGAVGMVLTHYDTSSQRGESLELDTNSKPKVLISDDGNTVRKSYTGEVELDDSTWHHFCYSYNNNVLNLYLDGSNMTSVTKTTDTAMTTIHPSTFQNLIGARGNAGAPAGWINARIDNVVIYNTSRSASQIAALYAAQAPQYGAATFYFSTAGSDSSTNCGPTTPCKTITKANSLLLSPGDTIAFNRGNVWRQTSDAYLTFTSGTSGNNITYTAYGTGHRPRFLGSYNLSNTTHWEVVTGNIWRSTVDISLDIGVLALNSTHNLVRSSTYAGLNTQGEFYKNRTDVKTYVYSASNPGTYYPTIEALKDQTVLNLAGYDYITLHNLEARYGGSHCIDTTDNSIGVVVNNCSAIYCGGALQSGGDRIGNCIELSLATNRMYITNCVVSRCFDACYSSQAWNGGGTKNIYNNNYIYNQGSYCAYPWEYFNSEAASKTDNMTIRGNTFIFMGTYGFGTNAGRVRTDRSPAGTFRFIYNDNLHYDSSFANLEYGDARDFQGQYSQDYNSYSYSRGSRLISFNMSNFTSVATFQAAFPTQEQHGIEAYPYLVKIGEYYYPQAGEICFGSESGSYIGATRCLKAIFNQSNTFLTRASYDFTDLPLSISSVTLSTNGTINNLETFTIGSGGRFETTKSFAIG